MMSKQKAIKLGGRHALEEYGCMHYCLVRERAYYALASFSTWCLDDAATGARLPACARGIVLGMDRSLRRKGFPVRLEGFTELWLYVRTPRGDTASLSCRIRELLRVRRPVTGCIQMFSGFGKGSQSEWRHISFPLYLLAQD